MNYVIRELTLYRHFLLIDSPIPFEFIANPTNYNKDMSDFSRVTGLDVCSRPSGCWRVDCWKLLPKEFQRNNPVFTMLLKYDADLLGEGEVVDVRYSDIDVGEGVAGVNGQLVQILPSTFQPVVNAIGSLRESNSVNFDSLSRSIVNADVNNVNGFNAVKDSVDTLQTSNHADLSAVKSSVDAFQTSNHADLSAVKSSVDTLQTSNHADLSAVKSSIDSFKSDLLNGVKGASDPLSFYLSENLLFTKDIRRLVSPVAVGFEPSWGRFITGIPFNSWTGVYTPVPMPLMVRFIQNGNILLEKIDYFKAGINTFHFYTDAGKKKAYIVDCVDGEGVTKQFVGVDMNLGNISALIYGHPVDD